MSNPTNPAPESAGEHEHCKHFNNWPMHAPDGIPSGDPGDGLGVQGECCGCDTVQPMPEGEQPHCPCYYATERSSDLWGDPGYCCGCGAALSASNPAPESAGGDCADCEHKTGMHYMRQNGSFGCRLCSSASEHHPAESAGHVHTYNMAGVCVTCGRDADALATDHHFCENDDSPTRGATMVLDLLARIVTSDRDDANVGLMVRRVLNEPTLKAIRKAASTPAAPQPRETRCDPDVPHYYGLPATGCFNCFPPGSPDPYASTDDGKGASPESAEPEPEGPATVDSASEGRGYYPHHVLLFGTYTLGTYDNHEAANKLAARINRDFAAWTAAKKGGR